MMMKRLFAIFTMLAMVFYMFNPVVSGFDDLGDPVDDATDIVGEANPGNLSTGETDTSDDTSDDALDDTISGSDSSQNSDDTDISSPAPEQEDTAAPEQGEADDSEQEDTAAPEQEEADDSEQEDTAAPEQEEASDSEQEETLDPEEQVLLRGPMRGTTATLLPGQQFNSKIKSLAKGSTVSYSTPDDKIKQIKQADSIPAGVTTGLISTADSPEPIIAWFDDSDGTIYYHTQVDKIYMNSDSSMMFYQCQNLTNLDVSNFDTSNVTNMSNMFYQCQNLTNLDVSNFDTSNVTDMESMFTESYNLTNLDVSNFDTSNVTNMSNMFRNCRKLTNLDVSNFDTSNVINMESMFMGLLITTLDISNFDTSNVTNMSSMFYQCQNLTNLDVSNFDTSNVTNMSNMFYQCKKLTNLDISSFDTSKVKSMRRMFKACSNLKTIYSSDSFITSMVVNDNDMFKYSAKLRGGNGTVYNPSKVDKKYARIDGEGGLPGYFTKAIKYILSFDTQGGSAIESQTIVVGNTGTRPTDPIRTGFTFTGRYDNTGFIGDEFDFENTAITGDIVLYAKWNKIITTATLLPGPGFNSKIKSLAGTDTDVNAENNNIKYFKQADSIPVGVTTGLISIAGSEPIIAWFDEAEETLFYHTQADIVYTNPDISFMFNGFGGLKELDLSNRDTSKTTSMRSTFQGCVNLKNLNIDSWDTSKVTLMQNMFHNCGSLEMLNLSAFKTSNVTNMQNMFGRCTSLTALDLSSFDTSNVTNMNSMFQYCENLIELNVSTFVTNKVTDMSAMFQNCTSLTGLDLSNFDTSKVTNMGAQFYNCNKLQSLNLTNRDTSEAIDMSYMFMGCNSLVELDLTSFDTSKATNMYAMFANSENIDTIYASEKFVTNTVTNSEYMFVGSQKIVGGFGTKYDANILDKEYALIDKDGQMGYFTDPNQIKVKFISDGSEYTGQLVQKSQPAIRPDDPSKTGHNFDDWYKDNALSQIFDFTAGITKYTEIYAKYDQIQTHTNGGSSGGGGLKKDNCPGGDFSPSYYDGKCGRIPENNGEGDGEGDGGIHDSASVGDEQNPGDYPQGISEKDMDIYRQVYDWAYENGFTNAKTFQDARMFDSMTRAEMAKISSIFAIQYLHKRPDMTKRNQCKKYVDVDQKSLGNLYDYVILSCELGYMGYESDGVNYLKEFNPYTEISRAEVATILSRMMRGNKYAGEKDHWYQKHLQATVDYGVIPNNYTPSKIKIRGDVFVMLKIISIKHKLQSTTTSTSTSSTLNTGFSDVLHHISLSFPPLQPTTI